jgi:hypothetical protein
VTHEDEERKKKYEGYQYESYDEEDATDQDS